MKKWVTNLVSFSGISLITMMALSSCRPTKKQILDRLSLRLDPEISAEEKAALTHDIYTLLNFEIQPPSDSRFVQIFGSKGTQSVARYLKERIHYIVPSSIQLSSRLSPSHTFFNASANLCSLAQKAGVPIQCTSAVIYRLATNIGTVLWFQALDNAPQVSTFRIGNKEIPLTSSRVGIIQLGEGYTARENDKPVLSDIERIAVLVHEARHSDCTGGVRMSDVRDALDGISPLRISCGHLHVRCPRGHELDGALACDKEAWGAYSIQAHFAAALANSCQNCAFREKQIALIIQADALSRVIPLDDLANGNAGAPDMSSSNKILDQTGQ